MYACAYTHSPERLYIHTCGSMMCIVFAQFELRCVNGAIKSNEFFLKEEGYYAKADGADCASFTAKALPWQSLSEPNTKGPTSVRGFLHVVLPFNSDIFTVSCIWHFFASVLRNSVNIYIYLHVLFNIR